MSSPSLIQSDRFELAWRLEPRTKIRCRMPLRLDGENQAVKTGSLAKIDPHPLMTWCEDNGVDYLFGLSRNARLTERIGRQLRKSRRRCVSTGAASRRFCDFRYRTRTSWNRTRRVVAKGLPGPRGLNARFVVTSLGCKRAGARVLYEKLYCARGEMENRIKEQQLDLFADRTSTATMRANQLRLDFATFASHLTAAIRRVGLDGTGEGRAQAGTIRTKLLKVAVCIRISVRRVLLSFSSVWPWKDLFARVLANLRVPPTPT